MAYDSYGALGTDRYPPFTLQNVPDHPATVGEIVTKMLTFAGLTLIASGLLARMAQIGARNASHSRQASPSKGSGSR